MKAVQTYYVPATDTKPRRVMVKAFKQRAIVPEPDVDGNDVAVHRAAMEPVISGWWGPEVLTRYAWTAGGSPDGRGNVWVANEK